MNMTAEADVIEELDESETFRPTPNNHNEEMKNKNQPNSFNGNQRTTYGRQDATKQLSKMNSGRTR